MRMAVTATGTRADTDTERPVGQILFRELTVILTHLSK